MLDKMSVSRVLFSSSKPVRIDLFLDGREIEGHPLGQIQSLNEQDAEDQYAIEAMDYGDGILSGIRSRTRSHTDHIIISWEIDDPDNPHNWSTVQFFSSHQPTIPPGSSRSI